MALLRRRPRAGRSVGPSESPFTERRFIASAAAVGVVVVAGVVVLMAPPPPPAATSGSSTRPLNPGAATRGSTADPESGRGSGGSSSPGGRPGLQPDGTCPPPAQQGTEPAVSQPAGTQWQAVDSYLLPFSATVGPAVVDADIARCYTRTPAGAVFAAVHGSWRYQRTSDWGPPHSTCSHRGPDARRTSRNVRPAAAPTRGRCRPPPETTRRKRSASASWSTAWTGHAWTC